MVEGCGGHLVFFRPIALRAMPFGRAKLCRAENGQSRRLDRVSPYQSPYLGLSVGIGVTEGVALAPGVPIGDIPGTAGFGVPGTAGFGVPGRAGLGVPGTLGMLPLGRLGMFPLGRLGFVLPGTRGGLLPGTLGGLLPGTRGGLFPGTLGLLGLVCAIRTENAATHTATMPKYFICFIRSLS